VIEFFHKGRITYGVNITKDDTKVRVVTFPYNPLLVEKIKTIPCHKWASEKKYGSFSDTDVALGKILKTPQGFKKGVVFDRNWR
jgi:hypothetical protein